MPLHETIRMPQDYPVNDEIFRRIRTLVQPQTATQGGKQEQTIENALDILATSFREQTIQNTELLNGVLKSIDDAQMSRRVMEILFNRWAQDGTYDRHMRSTGHDKAVELLIKQAMVLQRIGFGNDYKAGQPAPRIFGSNILEASCGTGTVIELLHQNLRQEHGKARTYIANDISKGMKKEAREKLAPHMRVEEENGEWAVVKAIRRMVADALSEGQTRVVFTESDLRELDIKMPMDTAVLSQTLHLIADPKKLPSETTQSEMETREHRGIKISVFKKMFEKLNYGDHVILIDEWPAVLTNTDEIPSHDLVSMLFRRTFRPVLDRGTLIDMIKEVKTATFVAELKMRIDKRHSMYMMIYRKDDRAGIHANGHLIQQDPAEADAAHQKDVTAAQAARRRAALRLYKAFLGMDREFTDAYNNAPDRAEGWVTLIPLDSQDREKRILCCAGCVDKAREQMRQAASSGDRLNSVVINQVLQAFDEDERKALIAEAIAALRPGGALMFIEEWPPSMSGAHHVGNHQLRNMMANAFDCVMFQGALRETIVRGFDSGMYGYFYRKVDELEPSH